MSDADNQVGGTGESFSKRDQGDGGEEGEKSKVTEKPDARPQTAEHSD